ncbi:sugar (pentulose or hexulose) kinase [Bradyrhizobium sp. GM7.3]
MYLGIDLGTSAVKIVLVDDAQRVVASRSRSLTVSSPRPGHCEQDPAQWIEATFATLDALKADHARELAEVVGIRPVRPDARRDAARRQPQAVAALHSLE